MCFAESVSASDERNRLLRLLHELGQDPYRGGDFSERDLSRRNAEVLIFRQYAISYWADHAVKELKVIDIRDADK